jgi:hypothetical protein
MIEAVQECWRSVVLTPGDMRLVSAMFAIGDPACHTRSR